jgi:hypothetical protein
MSNGVVVVPSSMKPRTWNRSGCCTAVSMENRMDRSLIAVETEDDRHRHYFQRRQTCANSECV